MTYPWPDRAMCWTDGSAIPAELRDMLLSRLDPGFEIEHADFEWQTDGSLAVILRLAVTRPKPPQIWEVRLSYQASEATALRAEATSAEREWFTMMISTHITEWWETRAPGIVESARHIKSQCHLAKVDQSTSVSGRRLTSLMVAGPSWRVPWSPGLFAW
jgi:hypothetical protein